MSHEDDRDGANWRSKTPLFIPAHLYQGPIPKPKGLDMLGMSDERFARAVE